MTDEPTKNTPDQPTQGADPPTPPPPAMPPTEPSGVGFAAIRLPGQQPQPPMQPAPPSGPMGYQPPTGVGGPPPGPPSYTPPPPPPPPPGAVYRYDYAGVPQNRSGGPPLLLIGIIGFALVLLVGAGGMLALGVGPFARPTPTLIAQASPTAPHVTPTPRPTASGGPSAVPSPTGSAGPTATPIPSGDVTDALLSHIPAKVRSTCLAVAGSDAIVAVATCSADDGNIQLIYFQYDSYDSMFTTYDSYRLASQIEADTGDCNNHDSWPAENGFNISGQLAGRWLCTEALGSTQLYWTDSRLNILSQATQTVPDYPRLIDFWVHESGPDL